MSSAQNEAPGTLYITSTKDVPLKNRLNEWSGNWLSPIAGAICLAFLAAFLIVYVQTFPHGPMFHIKTTAIVYTTVSATATGVALLTFLFLGTSMGHYMPFHYRLWWILMLLASLGALVFGLVHVWTFYDKYHAHGFMTDYFTCAAINVFTYWQSMLQGLATYAYTAAFAALVCTLLLFSPEQFATKVKMAGVRYLVNQLDTSSINY